MRVALFSRNARPADAIGRQVAAKHQYFRGRGAEVRLYMNESEPLHPDLDEVVSQTARELWRSPEHRHYLLSCDAIVAEFGAAYDLIELLPALAGRGPRIVVDYHGITPRELADAALQGEIEAAVGQRGLLWAADCVLVHSRFAEEELRSATGLLVDRLRHVRLPIHPLSPARPVDLRQLHGLTEATVLLFVGRLARNKQPAFLVRALEHLPASVHAVFVGAQEDIYRAQKLECSAEAQRFGVEERVHFVGAADEASLDAWYRAADVLVVPSGHECFGLPVVEALARGTPVVCSDQGALPETLGHAGLTFRGDSTEELANQVRRVLAPSVVPRTRRIALVAHRFGTHFAGGAEASLRRMAHALRFRGYQVEVFTTCNEHESRWDNTLPAGTTEEGGFRVHRFLIDQFDHVMLSQAYEAILRENGKVGVQVQRQFLNNSLGSRALVAALNERRAEFAAILTGPYLFKLTYDIARHFGEQVLLAPCFHDEPLARLALFQETYRAVGGLLFHSEAEARLTAEDLAVNHPRHALVGTLLPDSAFQGNAARGRRDCGNNYIVYCGRYCPEKGLDRLLGYMEQYIAAGNDGIKLVCLGQGPLTLPRRPWLRDLGFVDELTKRDVIAGALALVNLSRFESLSIVALEAWALGVPVVVDRGCAVLVEQVRRSQAGVSVNSQEEFRGVLDQWQQDRETARSLGQEGQAFVRREYASPERYADTLVETVTSMQQPLCGIARNEGLKRAAQFSADTWQDRFSQILEEAGARTNLQRRVRVDILPIDDRPSAPVGASVMPLTVRLRNQGTGVLADGGPARCRLVARVEGVKRRSVTSLQVPLVPGQEQLCVASVPVPGRPGSHQIHLTLLRGKRVLARRELPLHVVRPAEAPMANSSPALMPLVHTARQALSDARRLQNLPDDYVDVTEGKLAGIKRKLKRKLLNNFRRAYVDVGFQQQSALNRKLIAVMSLLLDTATVPAGDAALRQRVERLERQLRRERQHRGRLQRQLDALAAPAVPAAGEQ